MAFFAVDFFAVDFFAVVFFAVDFFAVVFFAGTFFAAGRGIEWLYYDPIPGTTLRIELTLVVAGPKMLGWIIPAVEPCA